MTNRSNKADTDPAKAQENSSSTSQTLTVDEVLTILRDECDGQIHQLLRHNQAKYEIPRWKHEPVETDFKYDELEEKIDWRNEVGIPKERWEANLDKLYEKVQESENSSTAEKPIPQMDPDEFFETFDWLQMKDREIARKCHQWISENEHVIYVDGRVLVYDHDRGLWIDEEQRVAGFIQRLVREHYGNNVKTEYIEGYVKVKDCYRVDSDQLGLRGTEVAVANGVLDLEKGEIVRDLSPDDYAVTKIPTEWDRDAECSEWEDFIDVSVEAGKQNAIQEFSGFMLMSNEYPYDKAMMLLGDGDNGKTVYSNTITKVLGQENVSGAGLSQLANDRFTAYRLDGKLANINADIDSGKIQNTSFFKSLVGGDRIQVERKFEDPRDIRNTAKLVFAANRVPKVKNAELAFYKRWIFVQFPRKFTRTANDGYPDADPHLEAKLEKELPGILKWAVDGFQRYWEQGHFTNEADSEEIREEWDNYADPTATFVRNHIATGNPQRPNREMTVQEVYDYYCKFIETTPNSPVSKKRLYNYITTRFEDAETDVRRLDGFDKPVNRWDGIHVPLDSRKQLGGWDMDTDVPLSPKE
ncbi:phage/plasmid primase, P4 family [Natrialbaceae archaeon A-arb3/5]